MVWYMKTLRLVVICGVVLASYFGAYFLSVTQRLLTPLGPPLTRPVYRPFDNGIARAFFAPAHFVDAACLRPARWDEKLLR
jgi:hypothetical protein